MAKAVLPEVIGRPSNAPVNVHAPDVSAVGQGLMAAGKGLGTLGDSLFKTAGAGLSYVGKRDEDDMTQAVNQYNDWSKGFDYETQSMRGSGESMKGSAGKPLSEDGRAADRSYFENQARKFIADRFGFDESKMEEFNNRVMGHDTKSRYGAAEYDLADEQSAKALQSQLAQNAVLGGWIELRDTVGGLKGLDAEKAFNAAESQMDEMFEKATADLDAPEAQSLRMTLEKQRRSALSVMRKHTLSQVDAVHSQAADGRIRLAQSQLTANPSDADAASEMYGAIEAEAMLKFGAASTPEEFQVIRSGIQSKYDKVVSSSIEELVKNGQTLEARTAMGFYDGKNAPALSDSAKTVLDTVISAKEESDFIASESDGILAVSGAGDSVYGGVDVDRAFQEQIELMRQSPIKNKDKIISRAKALYEDKKNLYAANVAASSRDYLVTAAQTGTRTEDAMREVAAMADTPYKDTLMDMLDKRKTNEQKGRGLSPLEIDMEASKLGLTFERGRAEQHIKGIRDSEGHTWVLKDEKEMVAYARAMGYPDKVIEKAIKCQRDLQEGLSWDKINDKVIKLNPGFTLYGSPGLPDYIRARLGNAKEATDEVINRAIIDYGREYRGLTDNWRWYGSGWWDGTTSRQWLRTGNALKLTEDQARDLYAVVLTGMLGEGHKQGAKDLSKRLKPEELHNFMLSRGYTFSGSTWGAVYEGTMNERERYYGLGKLESSIAGD